MGSAGQLAVVHGFELIVNSEHRLANRDAIDIDDLREEQLLLRTYCERRDAFTELLRGRDIRVKQGHELYS